MVSIVWTEASVSDMKEIFDFIASDSKRYAEITNYKIFQRVQDLIFNPKLGRIVPEFNNSLIRELIEGRYRIIYKIKNEKQVDVIRIYHSSRLLNKKVLS